MTDPRKKLKHILLIVALCALVAYGLFEARRYLAGPVIHVDSPTPNSALVGPQVEVRGFGRNLAYLYINGSQAYLNEKGELSYTYTPPKGYTVLTVEGKDRFGRTRTLHIPFVVQ